MVSLPDGDFWRFVLFLNPVRFLGCNLIDYLVLGFVLFSCCLEGFCCGVRRAVFVHALHVMAGKERKGSLEGLASKIRKIDGSVPITILKNPAVVTKVGNINVLVKQSLEPKEGDVVVDEQVQQMEAESYLDKKEAECIRRFEVASLDEERFLKQKSKVNWLAVGDANTKFFHMSLKCKNHRNRIDEIRDTNGVLHEGGNVPIAFVNHYQAFLGVQGMTSADLSLKLFSHQLDTGDCNSALCIMRSLQLFTNLSGLMPSVQKSTAFFCHVPPHVKDAILEILPFEEGTLPVRSAEERQG
ncbi:hypothetical protein QVD17_30540 [Tagetes erecta]|uniref:RNA-directed DNA polymerase, eukaryota, reverse transcriptase zinc-binding domain protein n=1 Tax=Tagetes erecta TaxID=13708 RepID=A0AAD8NNB7_TARER|nr:hypothetical protein QVD17_30540 [Tagetes erecta]